MVIKREMSLDSVVFEEFSGGGRRREGGVYNIWGFERKCETVGEKNKTKKKQVCVFQSSFLPLSVSAVYMLFMSLTYMCPCLCMHVWVCASTHAGVNDKVLVHFPRFTNHFHGLTTQFDISSYNRMRFLADNNSTVFMLSYYDCSDAAVARSGAGTSAQFFFSTVFRGSFHEFKGKKYNSFWNVSTVYANRSILLLKSFSIIFDLFHHFKLRNRASTDCVEDVADALYLPG